MMNREVDSIRIKSYGFQELSIKYSPDLQPASASKQLLRWVMIHPDLKDKLTEAGWHRGARRLTPHQVYLIFDSLGEP